ncbi:MULTISPECIES: hypothetical protein [unclassified Pedobacter]|uniref:hypothetical protein n=1 Tax=unclassified Pedobacter TaxID=2628915 RepID=UPI001D583B2E|nr:MULTISPECIES: hypothetical protein [unclassified Pedobacter]CAH0250625.1 hypothetical protein SRABI36_03207 [Pedobacter sp. Bi36]CAH0275551.1 hypothetical protein SRABI126_03609 [Pedobacter sp. Bi126]
MKTELILLMACNMLLSACGSLKSKKTLHTENLQSNSDYQEHTDLQSWAKENTLLLDTSNSEYVVQITPVGKFRYSAENGFEGVAEKVLVSGKVGKRKTLHKQKQASHQLQRQKRSLESKQVKKKLQHIDKSRKPRWAAMCIGLVAALGLAYWLIRKRLFT